MDVSTERHRLVIWRPYAGMADHRGISRSRTFDHCLDRFMPTRACQREIAKCYAANRHFQEILNLRLYRA
jgi:hypothetical protein